MEFRSASDFVTTESFYICAILCSIGWYRSHGTFIEGQSSSFGPPGSAWCHCPA